MHHKLFYLQELETVSGSGVTAALLMQNNVTIFNENELDLADAYLKTLEDELL